MVAPSRRKELAQHYIKARGISIRLACLIFNISITCYYYQPKTADENEQIAKLLTDLTSSHKNWGLLFSHALIPYSTLLKLLSLVEYLCIYLITIDLLPNKTRSLWYKPVLSQHTSLGQRLLALAYAAQRYH